MSPISTSSCFRANKRSVYLVKRIKENWLRFAFI